MRAIDLFAGWGGFTLGATQADDYDEQSIRKDVVVFDVLPTAQELAAALRKDGVTAAVWGKHGGRMRIILDPLGVVWVNERKVSITARGFWLQPSGGYSELARVFKGSTLSEACAEFHGDAHEMCEIEKQKSEEQERRRAALNAAASSWEEAVSK